MACPRCSAQLVPGFGALREDVCPACRGRFLPPDAVERVLVDENGVSREMLRALVPLFHSRDRIVCPSCSTKMSPLVVRGVSLELCTGCGGVWLDPGELLRLGGGRYEELTPVAEPVAPPPSLQSTKCAVFLHSLDALDPAAVSSAFARCPGLAAQDALALARNNNGVVVDGVGPDTARIIARTLSEHGIPAAAADDSWTTLVRPTSTNAFAVVPGGIKLGREADGPLIPFRSVACVAAGFVRRSTLKQVIGGSRDMATRNALDGELVVVEGDDAMIEMVVFEPTRRFRIVLGTAIFGDEHRGRPRLEVFCERLAELGASLGEGTGVGRGVHASVAGQPLPRYRSQRDLEREEAWLLWRNFGPAT